MSVIVNLLFGAVVLSSLTLLLYGLNPEPGAVEILHLPTTAAQIIFIFAVIWPVGYQTFFTSINPTERGLMAALLLYVLAISLTSSVPSAPVIGPSWVVHICFFATLIALFRQQKDGGDRPIWITLGLGALLHVAVFLAAWAIWPDRIRQGALPAFDNIRHLGYFLAPAAAVMALQYVTQRGRAALPLVCFSAATFYLLYTGSRGGAVALAAGLCVVAAFMAWHRQPASIRRVMLLAAIAALCILVSELLPPLPWKPIFGRGVEAINQTGAELLTGRAEVWGFTVQTIAQNWLWGYGPAIMAQIPDYQGASYRHPHNIGLQLLLHWGVVGTVIIVATALAFARHLWAAVSAQPKRALLPFAALATMGIHALVDGGLYYPFSTVIAIIAFTVLDGIGWRNGQPDTTVAP